MKVIPSISPSVPMLVLWGDEDKLTPADGPLGKYLQVSLCDWLAHTLRVL